MDRARIKVALCDDDALTRQALRLYVESSPDLTLVGSLSSGEKALEFLATNSIDVLLLDVRMRGMDGFTVVDRLIAANSECKILYLTCYLHDRLAQDVMNRRVAGLMAKDSEPTLIVQAIYLVHGGISVLHPDFLRPSDRGPLLELRKSWLADNDREVEVLKLLFLGKSNGEIARSLHLSGSSVKGVLARMMSRAMVTNRTALVMAAMTNVETG